MKILVIANAAKRGGAESVIRDFYNEIKSDEKNQFVFLLSHEFIKETKNIKIIYTKEYNWIERLFFDYYKARKIIKKNNPDIVISFQNTIIHGTDKKQIIYLQQSLPFQKEKNFSFFKKNELELAIRQHVIGFLMKKTLKKAYKIIVQSNWMKTEVAKQCNINENNIYVVKPKVNINKEILNSSNQLNNKSFFYPTHNCIYKNNELVYYACRKLNEENINDFKVELTIEKKNNISANIKFIGMIPREEVFKKYKESILIFPSYIETVGLPLLEAKLCGTIILVADTPFAHETLDDYKNAYFFNPFEVNELYILMKKSILGELRIKKNNKVELEDVKEIKLIDIISQQ